MSCHRRGHGRLSQQRARPKPASDVIVRRWKCSPSHRPKLLQMPAHSATFVQTKILTVNRTSGAVLSLPLYSPQVDCVVRVFKTEDHRAETFPATPTKISRRFQPG